MPWTCYHRLMPRSEIVWAGYYVVRVVEAPSGLRRGALSEQILTLSSCITEFFPDTWALDWVTCSEEDRFDAAAQLGIRGRALPTFARQMTEAFDASQLGWPNVWLSLDAARQAARDFLPPDAGVLVGLGLPLDLVDGVLAAAEPKPGEGRIGLYSALSQRLPLDPAGEPIGWEILGLERGGTYHSWLCNSLHVHIPPSIGEAASGAFGTIASEQHARDILATIARDPSIAEPVPWFLGRLFRYSL